MLFNMMMLAYDNQHEFVSYFTSNRRQHSYKQASLNDNEYERDIVLDEDGDDYRAFDYEDPEAPKLKSPKKQNSYATKNGTSERKPFKESELIE